MALVVSSQAFAQEYVPVTEATLAALTPSATVAFAPLTCPNPPKLADLGTFKVTESEMSRSLAGRLGLPLGGLAANASGRVLIQDFSRTKKCTASDGKTELVYGQAVRIVASSDNFDADGRFDLPTIAANTTLKNSSSNITAEVIGLTDTALLKEATKIFGALNVDEYDRVKKLIQILSEMAITTADKGTPQLLGMAAAELDMSAPVMGAYAVQRISDGKNCQETKATVPGISASANLAIENAYFALAGTCSSDAPDAMARAAAKDALAGFKVKK
ncbi:hypothetical protein V475_21305 [Sphingobium baderi LL03]|uniref:Uncharacterized protein n=1 Tax=Sphingobium baderi LL03 TaxID=1114964 RepID=T0GQ37_9SPHN|nr:hypothetical protein L485_08815 [Sphingobium baderi LL03]KMS54738.1 hypothetical protein V475_21305 [Sphingobium baderi LL03]